MSIYELNIGLGTDPALIGNRVFLITGWLNYRRPLNTHEFGVRVHPGPDEFVLVARVPFKSTQGLKDFENLSTLLRQECIAVWHEDTRTGYLIGEKRLNWGDFDITKFVRY